MIISHKYKFLFIGLPFSASSAITKELHEKYEGKPFLRKHSLYHEFLKVATKEEKDFFVFAVLRNPMEIVITMYEKMRTNAKGNYTNPELFKENGGHITKKQRRIYQYIKDNNASFQEYFLKFYNQPYNNLSSLTLNHCDFIIRYEKLNEDYESALIKIGIQNPDPLQTANRTDSKKKSLNEYYTEDIQSRCNLVFGPFLKKYNLSFPENWGNSKIPIYASILFNISTYFRKLKWRFQKHTKRKSIKSSIYGKMQREKENDRI
tara:strand:- start:252 stop:1040 length:789 start_codon:yes stop_codon:yes gene_type:complete